MLAVASVTGLTGRGVVAPQRAPSAAAAAQRAPAATVRPQYARPSLGPRRVAHTVSSSGNRRACAVWAARRATVMSAAMENLEELKEKRISQVEIPNFIMRDDFADQLYRWSMNLDDADSGRRVVGMATRSEPHILDDGEGGEVMWGFTTEFVANGETACTLYCGFDDGETKKYKFMGRNNQTGMPIQEGDHTVVRGKNFEIWKLGKEPVDDDTKASIKVFCLELADAINRYYSFGSTWSEDI